jgi:hypothetical protein
MVGHHNLNDGEVPPVEVKLASRDHPYTRIFNPVIVFATQFDQQQNPTLVQSHFRHHLG